VVYIDMTTQASDVVEQYYRAFDLHMDGWQDLVSDDVVFDGPVQHARGKAEFVALTAQFLQAHRRTHVLSRMADGNHVATLFEFVIDAPTGESMKGSVAELATVHDGRIKEFRVYNDPRVFMQAFGLGD
jgi:ketosteroid isomerase-like protein